MFPIQNGLKQEDALSPFLFNFTLEYAIRKVQLHNFYSSPSIIMTIKSRRMRKAQHVTLMMEKRNAYRIMVGKLDGKRLLGRRRCRWEGNIKMGFKEIG
jgi:hypothetical protein